MQRGRLIVYLLLLLSVALMTAPLAYFGTWAVQVAACRSLTRPGPYLAYCDHPLYGSYEHAAYATGIEPGAIAGLQRAQVLFFGNSRLQMGFSTPQVDAFFQQRGVPYHLLGFGYGESSAFPRRLLRRWHPAPKVVIINADPFFQDVLSPAAYAFDRAGWAGLADAAMKRVFGAVHGPLCRLGWPCPESAPATYRDAATGQWIWHDVLLPRGTVAMPITAAKAIPWSPADLPRWQREADAMLALLPVPRGCIILTGVPTPATDAEGMAAALGQRLGLVVVQPAMAGLSASDNSHLSADSAERWSAAFLAAAAPVIDACLAGRS